MKINKTHSEEGEESEEEPDPREEEIESKLKERLYSLGWRDNQSVIMMTSQWSESFVVHSKWKAKTRDFFDAFHGATDYGACSMVLPFLDFENPDTYDLKPRQGQRETCQYVL